VSLRLFARGAFALALFPVPLVHAQTTTIQPLPPVVVTANPLGSDLFDLVAPVSVLSGERLMLNMQPTLGELVNQIVGVNSSYYGPNASRPVIRGLDGDRVQILQNGLASFDASGTSVDHAVPIDTLTLKRVEIVRGPAVLLYGPTAIGGVVNTIDGRIPSERIAGAQGGVDLRYASPANERAAAGLVEFGLEQGLQFHADAFTRRTSDLDIPGYAYSPQLRATLPPDEQGPFGTLPNSASNSDGGSFGVAYVGDKGFVGGSYTRFNSDYGTVAEPDVTIKMKQERVDLAGQWLAPTEAIKSIDAKFASSRYQHTEFEGAEAGTTFKNDGWQGRVDVVHNNIGSLQGALGIQFVDFDFSALGEEGFLPDTNTRTFAAFVYEELPMDRWKFSIGGRYDYTRVSAQENEAFGPALTRNFNSFAVSLGATYNLTPEYSLVGSLAYTQRPPNYQELFADGPHIATGIFEVGDRNFGLEKSVGVELALRKKGDNWSGSLGAFYNKFSNYITLYDSGLIDPESELPIYYYRASAAEFYGIEAEANFNLGSYGPGRFSLELQADYLWAANTDLDVPLPRISPARFAGSLVYTASQWDARLGVFRVQAQDRVAPNEFQTDGYTMLDASFTYRLTKDRFGLTAFVKGTNLLNEDARNHVSYLVNIAPMPARGITVGVRGTF
jgi:iron complex outermembrane receptor protein